jgi:hypothetical protein
MATPFVKAAIMAVGAVVSAVSSFRQASATEDIANLEAQREAAAADAQAAQRLRDAESLRKRQVAAYSGSGVRSGAGTPLLIQKDTIKQGQEDIFNIQQDSLFAQASLRGRGAIGAAKLRSEGTSTLLTAGTKIAQLDWPGGSTRPNQNISSQDFSGPGGYNAGPAGYSGRYQMWGP